VPYVNHISTKLLETDRQADSGECGYVDKENIDRTANGEKHE
jgi:hypothetical protein